MAELFSTGFVDAKNTVGCVKDIMDGGKIGIYGGGAIPATADAAETGTLLAWLTKDGLEHEAGNPLNGIVMGSSVGGVLSSNGDSIKGVGLAAAGAEGILANYFRWYDVDVVTGESTVARRVQGAVGTTSAYELRLFGSTLIVEGAPISINFFTHKEKMS